jgi:phosphotransferase system IIA component
VETQSKTEGEAEMTKNITYHGFTDAATGQTIYVNPFSVRFVVPVGHRTVFVFSETHAVTVTADLQSVTESGLFSHIE